MSDNFGVSVLCSYTVVTTWNSSCTSVCEYSRAVPFVNDGHSSCDYWTVGEIQMFRVAKVKYRCFVSLR